MFVLLFFPLVVCLNGIQWWWWAWNDRAQAPTCSSLKEKKEKKMNNRRRRSVVVVVGGFSFFLQHDICFRFSFPYNATLSFSSPSDLSLIRHKNILAVTINSLIVALCINGIITSTAKQTNTHTRVDARWCISFFLLFFFLSLSLYIQDMYMPIGLILSVVFCNDNQTTDLFRPLLFLPRTFVIRLCTHTHVE